MISLEKAKRECAQQRKKDIANYEKIIRNGLAEGLTIKEIAKIVENYPMPKEGEDKWKRKN